MKTATPAFRPRRDPPPALLPPGAVLVLGSAATLASGAEATRRKDMATGKKIAVVCTGAVGGYAGAHMVKAGEDVTFIDFWPEHVDHMKANGLTITHLRDVEPFT